VELGVQVKALLEWESRAILGEELWSFTTQDNADAVLARLKSEINGKDSSRGVPLELHWHKSGTEFIGQVQHDRIELMRRINPLMWAFGNRHYYFVGRIASCPSGSVIEGAYKIRGWFRVVFLVVLNLFMLFSVGFLVGLGAKAIGYIGDGLAFSLKDLILGIGFLFVSTAVFLSVFGFLRYLDQGNRKAMYGFLARIMSGVPFNPPVR
jgi:hypothetical protein